MSEFDTIVRHSRRPMLTLNSKMRDIPPLFAHDVMPQLTFWGFEPCWIWMGPIDQYGYPMLRRKDPATGRRGYIAMRQYVSRMFWDFAADGVVRLTCPNINCLNPAHMVMCRPTWKGGK